jgi:hypothetical protein
MKILKLTMKFVLAGVLVFTVGPVFGQVVNPARVRVKGVGLDSTYGQVVKALGKPVMDGKPKEEGCIGGLEKNVEYSGLSFYFMDGDSKGGKTFEVKAFEVTSAKWIVSGVKVGDTEAVVRRKFGRKYTVKTDPDTKEKSWSYEFGENEDPGWTTVYFKNGKVVKISAAHMVC